MRQPYPFTSIVGQDQMKLALVLNAINPRIGGVLVRGERGTAKSTAVRALAALLPERQVVVGCHYSCDPDQPRDLCPDCRARLDAGEELPIAVTRMRLALLPVGASGHWLSGARSTSRPPSSPRRATFSRPGLLAGANRNILLMSTR